MTDRGAISRANGIRGAANERRAAAALGSKRIARRGSLISGPDLQPIDARGVPLCPEAKLRRHVRTISAWVEQCRRYGQGRPLIVVRESSSGREYAIVELDAFVAIAGIEPSQLPTRATVTKRSARQMELWADG